MKRFIEGEDRQQVALLPECLDALSQRRCIPAAIRRQTDCERSLGDCLAWSPVVSCISRGSPSYSSWRFSRFWRWSFPDFAIQDEMRSEPATRLSLHIHLGEERGLPRNYTQRLERCAA